MLFLGGIIELHFACVYLVLIYWRLFLSLTSDFHVLILVLLGVLTTGVWGQTLNATGRYILMGTFFYSYLTVSSYDFLCKRGRNRYM